LTASVSQPWQTRDRAPPIAGAAMLRARAPTAESNEISHDTFKEWTSTCGVRRVQDAYEKLAVEARNNSRSAPQEMVQQGYKDFDSFSEACPQFDLKCWPIDFAELGSGFVLYFHFLAFLAGLLAVMFLIQIPALYIYSQHDFLCRWENVSDWQHLYRVSGLGHNTSCADSGAAVIGSHWLSPGNLGPDSPSNSQLSVIYTVCVVLVGALSFFAYQHNVLTEKKVDARTVSPNDFAVIVRKLPASATDEKAIADFFREHAVEGKEDTEVVKVVIGWDASDFRDKIKEMRSIRDQNAELEPSDPLHAEGLARMKVLADELASIGKDKAARLKSSGTVVVIFRYAADMRACLRKRAVASLPSRLPGDANRPVVR